MTYLDWFIVETNTKGFFPVCCRLCFFSHRLSKTEPFQTPWTHSRLSVRLVKDRTTPALLHNLTFMCNSMTYKKKTEVQYSSWPKVKA